MTDEPDHPKITEVRTSLEGIGCLDLSDPMPIDLPVDEQIDWIRGKGVFTDCNDALARNYGYSKAAEVIGNRAWAASAVWSRLAISSAAGFVPLRAGSGVCRLRGPG